MRRPIFVPLIVLSGILLASAVVRSAQPLQHWSYVVGYQGLFSAGVPVDIAVAHLEFGPVEADAETGLLQVVLEVSTRGYDTSELLFPVQYCYRSRLEAEGWATLQTDWHSRAGSKVTRGRLNFDREKRRVVRLRARVELDRGGVKNAANEHGNTSTGLHSEPEQTRGEHPFPPDTRPMDRLSMLLWLREQSLLPGAVLQPAVSNGKRLLSYRIEVEGIETIEWDGGTRSSFRIRLDPGVKGDSDIQPIWIWLSRDGERLPLLLRSSRGFGNLEARLQSMVGDDVSRCDVSETEGLVLPPL